MIKISHRGNLTGPVPTLENNKRYVDTALKFVDYCEVDIYLIGDKLYMTHDPQWDSSTRIQLEWLVARHDRLIIHCKNIDALNFFSKGELSEKFHFFWHQNDDYTLTSKNWIWAYPGKESGTFIECIEKFDMIPTVAVMPEWHLDHVDLISEGFGVGTNYSAVCSDFVGEIK